LFRQQTGLSLSRYLLWSRLLDAIDAIAHGVNLTQAAHQANFADLAHMSRSFRATFGVTPSDLLKMTIAFKHSTHSNSSIFTLPSELTIHRKTFLLWPVCPDNWLENAKHAQVDFVCLANLLAQFELVTTGYSSEWLPLPPW
jgi:hypothetical protein